MTTKTVNHHELVKDELDCYSTKCFNFNRMTTMFNSIEIKLGFFALMLAITSSPAIASTPLGCTGTVKDLWVFNDGRVYVKPSWRGLCAACNVQICNINKVEKNVTPLACASWLTMLRTAVTNQQRVTMYYYDTPDTCLTMPLSDNTPSPGILMLKP
jgi:hypothetical protein